MLPDPIETVRVRAREIGDECNVRSEQHQASSWRWKLVGTVLAVGSAIFASTAGATLLSNTNAPWREIAGVFGLLGAVFTTVASQLGAGATADAHRKAAASFSAFGTEYIDLSLLPATDPAAMVVELEEINRRKNQVALDAPLPEPWTVRKVQIRMNEREALGDPPPQTIVHAA